MDKTDKLFNILRLYNIEERIFGELLEDLQELINSVKEEEINKVELAIDNLRQKYEKRFSNKMDVFGKEILKQRMLAFDDLEHLLISN